MSLFSILFRHVLSLVEAVSTLSAQASQLACPSLGVAFLLNPSTLFFTVFGSNPDFKWRRYLDIDKKTRSWGGWGAGPKVHRRVPQLTG
jgi:hypothetical protein